MDDDDGLFDMEPIVKPRAPRKSRSQAQGEGGPDKGATPATPYTAPARGYTAPATPYTPAEELQVWNDANPSMGVPVTIDRSLQVDGGCAKYDGCPDIPRCVLCPSSHLYWRTASDYTDRVATTDRLGYRSQAPPRTCEED